MGTLSSGLSAGSVKKFRSWVDTGKFDRGLMLSMDASIKDGNALLVD